MSENNFPEKIREVVSDVAEKLADKVDELTDKAEDLTDKLSDRVEELTDKAEDLSDKSCDKAEEFADKAESLTDKLSDKVDELADKAEDLSDKTLAELSDLFVKLKSGADSMARSKEAEAIKSAFYKLLSKLKGESGAESGSSLDNPFEAVEQNFKAMYADYRKERAEFNRRQDEQREVNLLKKQAVIEELKALVEGQEDVSARFPLFRELQNRWREAGQVPVKDYRNINDTYQFYVEKFYDMVKINRDLRDLDFRKNLEAKEAFCEAAEKLAGNDNVVNAFHELQKLHEQWKEYGPVAKEMREDIWNRFKAATAVINKKYQAHFEGLKEQQEENLEKKKALCERLEEIAATEVKSSSEWNALSKEIEELQAQWRKIGFATKKENQKIYDRFRAACDAFFGRKREYYSAVKDNMSANLEKKQALIEQAEALKDSTEWKKTTDQYISLQKQWKEIGAVPRKKSDQLWKRFRAACDEFFARRDANASPDNDFYANLKAKKKLVEEILAFEPGDDETANAEMMRGFNGRWQAIGHVPFKEKDALNDSFREAMQKKFPLFSTMRRTPGQGRPAGPVSLKDSLVGKYRTLQQNITTYENNIGFFSASKNSEPLIKQMQEKIEQAKEELRELEAKIRKAEEEDR